MITIVYCHPYPNSFNHNILQNITDTLTGLGREYDVMDLYADGFNPVMDRSSLELYSKGETSDKLVKKYQEALQKTKHAIFIFPIWWGMMPAMLKGWIDKVFLKGEIYDYTPEGAMLPCLSIDKTTIITTSENDSEVFAPFIEGYFSPMALNTVGFNGVKWFNCDHVKSGTDTHRKEFLESVIDYISK